MRAFFLLMRAIAFCTRFKQFYPVVSRELALLKQMPGTADVCCGNYIRPVRLVMFYFVTEQMTCEEGSGAWKSPGDFAASEMARLRTPGCTRVRRAGRSMSMVRLNLARLNSSPCSRGSAPPDRRRYADSLSRSQERRSSASFRTAVAGSMSCRC